MMFLKALWGSLRLLLGALGVPLGALWGLYIDHRGLPDSSWNYLRPRLLASCCFFSFLFVILSSMSYFLFFRGVLGSILSSQANPPTLKNLAFPEGILTCLKKQRFTSKVVLQAFWGSLGLLFGALGGLLGALWGL